MIRIDNDLSDEDLPHAFNYIPSWHAPWLKDSFARRMIAVLAETYKNAYGREETMVIGGFREPRITSTEEHDRIIAESDQMRIDHQKWIALQTKRKQRSGTLIGKIMNELS